MTAAGRRGGDGGEGGDGGRPPEQRRHARHVPARACPVVVEVAGTAVRGTLRDLSRRGARLRLAPGAPVATLAARPDGTLRVDGASGGGFPGRVTWCTAAPDGGADAGFTFAREVDDLGVPTLLDVRQVRVDPAWAFRVPAGLAVRRQVMPFAEVGGEVQVACADPADATALKALERFVQAPLRAVAAEPTALRETLRRLYGDADAAADPESPAALVNELLHAAWLRRASDVHVDPGQDGVRVRLRVDGVLEPYRTVPTRLYPELMSRIKVLGGMDIAERRAPQDGRFSQVLGGDERVDVRVATLPTKHGERATLRLLAGRRDARTLEELGMAPLHREAFRRAIGLPHGLLLATGPTGCGKTTTLYAALREIVAHGALNVITVEDPIEYDLPGVAQVEVDAAQKVSFSKAIRSLLRHDPDVIMIAEIRDQETVDVAVKAALTGHLVLASLHTNSAVSAITRLDDLGVARYLTSATVRLAMSQRLARRLCPDCRRPRPLAPEEAAALRRPELAGRTVCDPVGCVYCGGRGYHGRLGLFELLPVDEARARGVARGDDEATLATAARAAGVPSLLDDAVEKLLEGLTSVPEVLAAVVG